MSEKKLSKEQLEVLKQIINSEEKKSAKEGLDEQNVKNTDTFEAFGRAIIEQIKHQSMEEAEEVDGSTDEVILDTRIIISPGTAEEQENWLSDIVDVADNVLDDAKDAVGDAIDKVYKKGKKELEKEVCINIFGQKICFKS